METAPTPTRRLAVYDAEEWTEYVSVLNMIEATIAVDSPGNSLYCLG
jgi:hypothetical protein